MERSKQSTFIQTKVVGDSRSIATKNVSLGETYCGQLPEKQSAPICRQVL